ncbi:MAG: amidophosphoribosyltransferase [Candidatus Taylorbacteria bacterium]|nr:amidophosphoribosyltransferase [Candidatus Taylorbacteria bacterium]
MNFYPKDSCGIVGVFGTPNAAKLTALGLHALQHRGEEGAGIVSVNDYGQFNHHKNIGLVSQVFANGALDRLIGNMSIGHNRYSTTGKSVIENVQPLLIDCQRGKIALAHNGNLININALRSELASAGAVFQTSTDSEFMLHLIARSEGTLSEAIGEMMSKVSGAYSLVICTKDELVGVRDPRGFRPLCIGTIGGTFVFASETCALDLMGARFIRDVLPGEMVFISKDGLRSEKSKVTAACSFCIFELVYFERPNSKYIDNSVHSYRFEMGITLFKEQPCEADVIVPVPDSGTPAAFGFASASKIPLEMAFVRSHYTGRSFIQPERGMRVDSVKMKLALIGELVKGKRVVMIDDSVVRGTTCIERVKNLRDAGATEVHIRVSCPPHKFACHYGIDFPDRNELIAVSHQGESLCKALNVDSIGYLSEEGLLKACGGHSFCMACFNGKYPITPECAK